MNVLIVDDELMMLEMAKDTVEEVVPDSSVETSFDPCRALEMAQKKKYDVALLDIEMPEMTGLELAKKLKMIDSHINIIFVTAYAEYALDVRRHIVVGANCILFSVYRPTRLCRIGTYRRF